MTSRSLSALTAAVVVVCAVSDAAAEDTSTRPLAELLEVLEGKGSAEERKAAAADLVSIAKESVPELTKFLKRKRQTGFAQRRAVIKGIGAAAPNKKGQFRNPKRKKAKQVEKEDQFDWMPKLLVLDANKTAVREIVADVAVIRALAASKNTDAGDAIFRLGFDKNNMVYRDECGRYLRLMAPYSVPALVRRAAITRKYSDTRRYATYQLERLDLESPKKSLRAASADEDLLVALLFVFGDTLYRSAVQHVLAMIDHDAPRVRAAARKAWLEFVIGKEPPAAPRRKWILPGGKFTKKKRSMYLNSRELATIHLRNKYEEVLGRKPERSESLKDRSTALFQHFDDARYDAERLRVVAALASAKEGDLAGAIATLDEVLARHPKYEGAGAWVPLYMDRGKQLTDENKWSEAATAYAKAHALAPDGEDAKTALATHYYALGRAREAVGGDAKALFDRATEIQPRHREAVNALSGNPSSANSGSSWMLYAGVGGGATALLLLALGLVMRRNQA